VTTLAGGADFLAAARGRRQARPGFTLQARRRGDDEAAASPVRVGFTCSRKVGNAVARNRAKRRLRAAARAVLPGTAAPAGTTCSSVGRRRPPRGSSR
jgi:ribonuclease P protein component